MKKITYLLGAGASANALPLIKKSSGQGGPGLPQELKNFIEKHTSSLLTKNESWDSKTIGTLNDIADKCIEFGTPDLYAKFLLETGDSTNYKILKTFLSVFFKVKQDLEGCFDFRALSFLTTISQNQKIPDNIKILTWNYDKQLEIAATKLKPLNPGGYSMIQGFSSWPNMRDGHDTGVNPFLFHLNGVAGYIHSERNFYEDMEGHFSFKTTLNKETLLSFAWEDEVVSSKKIFHEQRLPVAREIASQTQILVIIGYSFPFFNRNIDKEIMNTMMPSLQKIYVQDPFYDGSRLNGLFDIPVSLLKNIIHVEQVDNYHIPYEL
jgi:hypothetical protein